MSATVLAFPTARREERLAEHNTDIADRADEIASGVLAQVYQEGGYFQAASCPNSIIKLVTAVEELTRHSINPDTGRVVDMKDPTQLNLF